MVWWQQGDRDSGMELVNRKRAGAVYAEIEHVTCPQPAWEAKIFTGDVAWFNTEAEAEAWVNEKLGRIAADLAEIPELYK